MIIREMQIEDIPYVQEMFAELQNLHADNEPDVFVKNVVREENYYREKMNNPNKIIFVAICENGERDP